MQKLKTWASDMEALIHSRVSVPFSWGTNDCALFVADAVKAMTGTDMAEQFRGKYHDDASANAILTTVAGAPTVDAVMEWAAKQYGLAEIKPAFAQRGDIVVIDGGAGDALGILFLNSAEIVGVGPEGLMRGIPVSAAKRAWKINTPIAPSPKSTKAKS